MTPANVGRTAIDLAPPCFSSPLTIFAGPPGVREAYRIFAFQRSIGKKEPPSAIYAFGEVSDFMDTLIHLREFV